MLSQSNYQVAQRVNYALFRLLFIKSCTNNSIIQALRIRLIQSIVTSHLDYCSVVYRDAFLCQKARLHYSEVSLVGCERTLVCIILLCWQNSPHEEAPSPGQTIEELCARATRIIRTDLEIPKAKKSDLLSYSSFRRKGISWIGMGRFSCVDFVWLKYSVIIFFNIIMKCRNVSYKYCEIRYY